MLYLLNPILILPPLLLSLLIDVFFREFPGRFHPVVWMGSYINKTSELADKYEKNKARFFAGAAVVLSGLTVFCLPSEFVWQMTAIQPFFIKMAVMLIVSALIKSSFSLTALLNAGRDIALTLENGQIEQARNLTSRHLVSRDTSELNEGEIAAAVIGSISENFTDSVFAPMFFLVIGGPAAAIGYRFVNTCDSLLGYRNEKLEYLGKFAARFDDVLNFLPARISGLLICLSSSIQKDFSGKRAFSVMLHEHGRTASPNAGWTMAAAAGALDVKLLKIGYYSISDNKELPANSDIIKTLKLIRGAAVICFILAALALVAASGFLI